MERPFFRGRGLTLPWVRLDLCIWELALDNQSDREGELGIKI